MADSFRWGVSAVCPVCEKKFFINNPDLWVFKRRAHANINESELFWFDKYSCKKAFEEDYEKTKKKRRSEAALKSKRRVKHGRLR